MLVWFVPAIFDLMDPRVVVEGQISTRPLGPRISCGVRKGLLRLLNEECWFESSRPHFNHAGVSQLDRLLKHLIRLFPRILYTVMAVLLRYFDQQNRKCESTLSEFVPDGFFRK